MNDVINGLFEAVASLFLSMHCVRLWRDKQVKGVAIAPFVFFTAWGYWNLYYYPSVGHWCSFWGGVLVVAVNTAYCGMLFYYRQSEGDHR
jgi:hypothetical protein